MLFVSWGMEMNSQRFFSHLTAASGFSQQRDFYIFFLATFFLYYVPITLSYRPDNVKLHGHWLKLLLTAWEAGSGSCLYKLVLPAWRNWFCICLEMVGYTYSTCLLEEELLGKCQFYRWPIPFPRTEAW